MFYERGNLRKPKEICAVKMKFPFISGAGMISGGNEKHYILVLMVDE